MKKFNIFIDGQVGTTGLQIYDRLKHHEAVHILEIDPDDRKNSAAKKKLMQAADVTFLCLPDEAARDAAQLAIEAEARVIDASSAHRCQTGWVYGLPELQAKQREQIANGQLIANPGCYPTGALLLLKPLIANGALKADAALHINGFSGYSGGGKALIEAYENASNPSAFGLYGLDFQHKHLPEIEMWSGLTTRPSFTPSVVNTYQGMLVSIAINPELLNSSIASLGTILADYYADEPFVRYQASDYPPAEKFLYIEGLADTNYCDLRLYRSEANDQALLIAKLDNLGKGASGAAVQNMNIMLGLPEDLGVTLSAA